MSLVRVIAFVMALVVFVLKLAFVPACVVLYGVVAAGCCYCILWLFCWFVVGIGVGVVVVVVIVVGGGAAAAALIVALVLLVLLAFVLVFVRCGCVVAVFGDTDRFEGKSRDSGGSCSAS